MSSYYARLVAHRVTMWSKKSTCKEAHQKTGNPDLGTDVVSKKSGKESETEMSEI